MSSVNLSFRRLFPFFGPVVRDDGVKYGGGGRNYTCIIVNGNKYYVFVEYMSGESRSVDIEKGRIFFDKEFVRVIKDDNMTKFVVEAAIQFFQYIGYEVL